VAFARRLARPIGIAGIVRHIAESERAAWLLPVMRPTLIQIIANATRLGLS
jgi:hypothetical protein